MHKKLRGSTWWNEPTTRGRLELSVGPDSFDFEAVADGGVRYRGHAKISSNGCFRGLFNYPGGRGDVAGTLVFDDGEYRLEGASWSQPPKRWDWYAALDEDE